MIDRETLRRLEFDKILGEIGTYAHSDITRARLLGTAPGHDADLIRAISGRIAEIRALAAQGVGLRFQAFEDITPLLEQLRPVGAILSPGELLLFIPVLEIFGAVARQLGPRGDVPLLKAMEHPLKSFADILEPLSVSIDDDGAVMDSASTALREIRRAKRTLASRIRKKIEEIVRDNRIEIFLQDDFITQRSGRWVIPVRMDSKGMVKGVVHDVSSSGETAFMEPLEIIPFVNELENLSAEEKAEEIRVLRQLSAWIRQDAAEIGACFETLLTLDVLNSIAAFSDCHALERAELNEDGTLWLVQARHPILMMLRRQGVLPHVEPLDLRLDRERRVMVITGPNAGGKTIALKTAGVLVLMALCGMPVPADGARSSFPVLDTLLVDMGDDQSIEQSLSTFSAHMARTAAILAQAGSRTLALLDELGAGTEPQQGAAIACGVLCDLLEHGASVIATTHLSEIIGYVHATEGMVNAGMEYDALTYTPMYRLITGEPGHSHAIEIARRYGMPERVIDFAREMLGTASEEFTALLVELRRKREELDDARRQVDFRREELRQARKELDARAADMERARRDACEKVWNEARDVISAARRRMNELLEEYKRERRAESIEKLRRVETEIEERLRPEFGTGEDQHAPLRDVSVGDSVYIRSLGHAAVVLQLLPKQGKARVRVGSMEMEVTLGDMAPIPKKSAVKTPRTRGGAWRVEAAGDEERELKLIGMRVAEALDLLDTFLSHASLNGVSEVRIIHGLGSGKLRQSVREHLAHHQLVEAFRPGNAHEGRDGATVATLRS